MWVLDTNTLIHFFKGKGRVSDTLLSHTPGDIGIPAIGLYEFKEGIAKSSSPRKHREQLQALARNATLVTRNTREFDRISKLHVEDWY